MLRNQTRKGTYSMAGNYYYSIDIDGVALKAALTSAINTRREWYPDAIWTPPCKLHVTLGFLGNLRDGSLAEAKDRLGRLSGTPAFDLHLQGLGVLNGGRGPRVLYADVVEKHTVEEVQTALGCVPGCAHVTLVKSARWGLPLPGLRHMANDEKLGVQHVNQVQLKLTQSGQAPATVASVDLMHGDNG